MLNKIFLISLLGLVLSGCGSLDLRDSQDISCQWPFKNHYCKFDDLSKDDDPSGHSYTLSDGTSYENKEGIPNIKGTPTLYMPQTGSATYWGPAYQYNGDGTYTKLTSQLEVNFGAKTVYGVIHNKSKTFNLNGAKIHDSEFSGGTTELDGVYSGKFYGKGASSVVGKVTHIKFQNDIIFGGDKK